MLPPSSLTIKAAIPESGEIRERMSELRAVVGLTNGRPELTGRYHTSPLKIAKTFDLSGDGGWRQLAIVQMDGSPGLLEGDRYSFDWTLKEGARLYATNQAYTRVHPCESGNGDSRIKQRFSLAPDAVLEWIPEPVMLFRDARCISETEVELGERSICMLGELFCPGRTSRGETFEFRSFDMKISVRHQGELVHYQRQKWEPGDLPIGNPGCFGEFTHIGTFSVFSDRVTPVIVAKLREALEGLEGVPEGLRWGVARTARYGLVVQMAGHAAWKLQWFMLAVWDRARALWLEQPPLRLLKEAWMA